MFFSKALHYVMRWIRERMARIFLPEDNFKDIMTRFHSNQHAILCAVLMFCLYFLY